jgi:hypothetical protein
MDFLAGPHQRFSTDAIGIYRQLRTLLWCFNVANGAQHGHRGNPFVGFTSV